MLLRHHNPAEKSNYAQSIELFNAHFITIDYGGREVSRVFDSTVGHSINIFPIKS